MTVAIDRIRRKRLGNGSTTYHGAEERGVDGAELRVDVGWIHLVCVISGG